ncbi:MULTISPECIES: TonB-dependent receptor domain-containing protein [Hyphomonas]|uniref:TonB-dependent receptor n=1 Tax=Hyphomonas adhaerens TaxID=81029 RepID=A0A3B9H3Z2_9PROT|nr:MULTISPECIES: TonB-dependent receptor [Hyphomonas]MBB41406.1 TonB-dependent receptor [Hyphomonas sp.]HAE29415.1 TonB-dependent receptor [Hyphomonas adhaerens]
MTLFKSGLLVSASFVLGFCAAAQTVEPTPVSANADEARELDTVIVVGQQQTYSSAESTEAMALQQAPVTSVLAQIDNLPGVQVQEGDAFGFDDWSTGVAVRGFQNNLGEQQVGITIDGMPNGGSNYGGGAKANRYIDTQNAGAIEVSQGTADIASRTNDALGGTLNFTTQNPLDERRVRVSASLGDFDSQRFYGRYDSGFLSDNKTKFWVSLSTQSATDHVNQSADNSRDHMAAKLQTEQFGIDWTSYLAYDDTHENNYQRLFSPADFAANPNSDGLTAEWTGVPYIDQLYRKAWGTLRTNTFFYLKGEKEVFDGFKVDAGVYRHDNDGRGDWVPQYVVNVGQYGMSTVPLVTFTDPAGSPLTPTPGCVSSITYPYGGAGPEYDPACFPANSIPVSSYRHTHYQKERTGAYADFEWQTPIGQTVDNTLRGGLWYEDATRYEYRDWHKLIDSRVGADYDYTAYWVQYNREFPQSTFKWYLEDVVKVSDFSFRLGMKQFSNEIERADNFAPNDAALNFKVSTDSDVLFSGGAAWTPSAVPGLEVFAGYAENFKAIPDTVLEVLAPGGTPDPETSENSEVGVRYSGQRFRGSLVYFDSTFDNRLLAVANQTVNGIDYLEASNGGYINGGGIESSGFEASGEFRATDNLSFFASYTGISDANILGSGIVTQDAATGLTVLDSNGNIVSTVVGNQVPGIAKNMAVVSADYTDGNFFAGLSTKWVDDRFVDVGNTWTAEGYYDADLYAGISGEAISDDLSNLDFRLTVNNLFDGDWLAGISGGGAWISAPRTVVFTVTADF